jgi:hypothetical protein
VFDKVIQTLQSHARTMQIDVDRIIDLWNNYLRDIFSDAKRKFNYFPLFQKYFKELLRQQVAKSNTIAPTALLSFSNGESDPSWNKQCSEAFSQFQQANSNWVEILDNYRDFILYNRTGKKGQKYRHRQKDFSRLQDSLQRTVSEPEFVVVTLNELYPLQLSNACLMSGFEGIYIACGSQVNTDQGLGSIWATDGAKDVNHNCNPLCR